MKDNGSPIDGCVSPQNGFILEAANEAKGRRDHFIGIDFEIVPACRKFSSIFPVLKPSYYYLYPPLLVFAFFGTSSAGYLMIVLRHILFTLPYR
jgi:hypothetical protein